MANEWIEVREQILLRPTLLEVHATRAHETQRPKLKSFCPCGALGALGWAFGMSTRRPLPASYEISYRDERTVFVLTPPAVLIPNNTECFHRPPNEVNMCSGCKGAPWGSILQPLGRIAPRVATHENHMKFIRTIRKSYVPYEKPYGAI